MCLVVVMKSIIGVDGGVIVNFGPFGAGTSPHW